MKDTIFIVIIFVVSVSVVNVISKKMDTLDNRISSSSDKVRFEKENQWKRDVNRNRWVQVVNDINDVQEPNANPSKKGVVVIVKGRSVVRKMEIIPRCHNPNVDCFRDVFDQCGDVDGCFCVFNGDSMDYCGMYPTPPNTP